MSYTIVATHATGDVFPASDWNTYIRDNMAYLLTASVEPTTVQTFVDSGNNGGFAPSSSPGGSGLFVCEAHIGAPPTGVSIGTALCSFTYNTNTTLFDSGVVMASASALGGLSAAFTSNSPTAGKVRVATAGGSGNTITVWWRRVATTG